MRGKHGSSLGEGVGVGKTPSGGRRYWHLGWSGHRGLPLRMYAPPGLSFHELVQPVAVLVDRLTQFDGQ